VARLLGPEMARMTSAMLGGITGGLCDNMLGRGVVEFRPEALVAIGSDGRERVRYHLEYRGGGSRVVVLPKDASGFTHMILDFDGRDRATVAAVGCVLVRGDAGALASPAVRAAAGGDNATAATTAAVPMPAANAGGAVLSLTAGATEGPGRFTPVVGREVWVLRGTADMALVRSGLQPTPDGTVMHHFMVACQHRAPECRKGLDAIQASTVSLVRTDAMGRARTAALPPGSYTVFSTLVYQRRPMVWQVPVQLHAGSNALALDLANARVVD
jgi:hypothetical protein